MIPTNATSELIADHRSAAGPVVTHVRGALIVSSLGVLRELGRFARYSELLDPAYREDVITALALSWVPIDVALAHYRACDALDFGPAELAQIAQVLSTRYADSIFGTMLRTSRQVGLDAPWLALRSQGRFWDRVYVGGGVRAYRLGPKDAHLEQQGLPLAQIAYFREAHRLWLQAIGGLFAKTVHVRLVRPREPGPNTMALAGSWV